MDKLRQRLSKRYSAKAIQREEKEETPRRSSRVSWLGGRHHDDSKKLKTDPSKRNDGTAIVGTATAEKQLDDGGNGGPRLHVDDISSKLNEKGIGQTIPEELPAKPIQNSRVSVQDPAKWEDYIADNDVDAHAKPKEGEVRFKDPNLSPITPEPQAEEPSGQEKPRPVSTYNNVAPVNPFTKNVAAAMRASAPVPPAPAAEKQQEPYSWDQFRSELATAEEELDKIKKSKESPQGRTNAIRGSRWSSDSSDADHTPRPSISRNKPPARQVEQYISFLCNIKHDTLGGIEEAKKWPYFRPPLHNLLDALAELCIFKEHKQTVALALSVPKNCSSLDAACTIFLSHDLAYPEAAVQHLKRMWALCQKGSRAAFPPLPVDAGDDDGAPLRHVPSKDVVILELFEEMFQYSFAKFRKDFQKHYADWDDFARSVILIAHDCPEVNTVGTLREDLESIHKVLLSKPAKAFSDLDRRHIGHSIRTILLKIEQKAAHIISVFRFIKPYNDVWCQTSGKKVDFPRYLAKVFRLVFHFRTLQLYAFTKSMRQFLSCNLEVVTINAVDGSVARDHVNKDAAKAIISECRDQSFSRKASVASGKSTLNSVPRAREFVLDYFSKDLNSNSLAQTDVKSIAAAAEPLQPHLECSLLVFLHNTFRDPPKKESGNTYTSKLRSSLMHPFCYVGVSRRPCELSGEFFLVYNRTIKRVVGVGGELFVSNSGGLKVRRSSGKLVERWVMPRFGDVAFNAVVRSGFKNDVMGLIAQMVDKVEEHWMMKGWQVEHDLGDYKKSINSFVALLNKFGETFENGITGIRRKSSVSAVRVPTGKPVKCVYCDLARRKGYGRECECFHQGVVNSGEAKVIYSSEY